MPLFCFGSPLRLLHWHTSQTASSEMFVEWMNKWANRWMTNWQHIWTFFPQVILSFFYFPKKTKTRKFLPALPHLKDKVMFLQLNGTDFFSFVLVSELQEKLVHPSLKNIFLLTSFFLSILQCYGLSVAPAPGFPVFSLQSPASSLGRMLRPASLNLLQISLWFLGINGIFQS